VALRRDVGGLQEFFIQNNLYGFHCGLLSTVYPTISREAGDSVSRRRDWGASTG
jgi:hypothetical protein